MLSRSCGRHGSCLLEGIVLPTGGTIGKNPLPLLFSEDLMGKISEWMGGH